MSIIITLLVFCIIVIIHEWGHFITAKKSGVEVPEFAVGMGPKIFSLTRNGTLYSIRLFPIGGFCRMKGENAEEGSGSFVNAPLINRMVIICAGSFMNFVLAVVVFTIMSAFLPISTTQVRDFTDHSPAKESGIQQGDVITEIEGRKIFGKGDISFALMDYRGGDISVKVKRDAQYITYYVRPAKNEERYVLGVLTQIKSPLIGDSAEGIEKASLGEVLYEGIYETFFSVKVTFFGLIRLLTAQLSLNDVSGPIGLVSVVDDVYNQASPYGVLAVVLNILQITGLLSANLCVMNMLPLPALDGGRFIFLLIEGIRRKPIPPEKEGIVHIAGFVLLMIFGLVVAFNDVIKIL